MWAGRTPLDSMGGHAFATCSTVLGMMLLLSKMCGELGMSGGCGVAPCKAFKRLVFIMPCNVRGGAHLDPLELRVWSSGALRPA